MPRRAPSWILGGAPLLAAMAVLAQTSTLSATQASPVAADPARPGIAWEKNFKTAVQRARAGGKPVLVDFWAQWCQWCHELDATTYRDSKVVGLAGDFVAVKVDTEGSLADVELTARYGVETLPTIGFLSPSGRLFLRRTGFEGPEPFAATLEQARGLAKDVIAWEGALARDDKDAAALAGLGALLFDQKLFAESRDLLRRARKLDQARPAMERKRTRRALGLVERQGGNRGESERLLREALAIEPAEPNADAAVLVALGETYLAKGQPEQARAAWQRALQTAPEGELARLATEALARLPAR